MSLTIYTINRHGTYKGQIWLFSVFCPLFVLFCKDIFLVLCEYGTYMGQYVLSIHKLVIKRTFKG